MQPLRGGLAPLTLASKAPAAPMPLDDYTASVYAVFAMRRMLTSYTGAIIRVRRSSDNTEQDIGYGADNLLDGTALAAFVGAGTGVISTWYDQKGSANFTSPTTGERPGILSGNTAIAFDGSNDNMRNLTLTPAVGWSVAFRVSGVTNAGYVYSNNNYNWCCGPNTASGVDWLYASADRYRTPAISSGVLALAGNQPYRNGSADGATLAGTPTFSGATYIGSRSSVQSPFLGGNLHNIIFHNGTWAAGTVASISAAI